MAKYLIVNADDFGLCEGVNQGIMRAAQQGIVTSTSLMVRQPGAAAAAAYAREECPISVGLHIDLGEWIYEHGDWVPLYQVVDPEDELLVAKEIAWQLEEFQRLVGRQPTHLDSHQHAHLNEPVRSITQEIAQSLGICLREVTPLVRYCGDFYGQYGEGVAMPEQISVASLSQILAALPEGITEMACHPGFLDGLQSVYSQERRLELAALCDPLIRQQLTDLDIQLCSFTSMAAMAQL